MKKKERGANTAFPLVFFLRSTCQNAELERKINKKVILYIIHRMRNFPPASKQKLLFPEAFLIERTWSSPAPRKGSVGARPSADPTVQGWLVWTCSSRLPPRNSLFFSLLAFLVILLGWECPMMSALFLGKRAARFFSNIPNVSSQNLNLEKKKKQIFENSFNYFPCSQIDIQLPDSNTCSTLHNEESFLPSFIHSLHRHSLMTPCAWHYQGRKICI